VHVVETPSNKTIILYHIGQDSRLIIYIIYLLNVLLIYIIIYSFEMHNEMTIIVKITKSFRFQG